MSTNPLYHVFGIGGYELMEYHFAEGRLVLEIAPKEAKLRCSACGSSDVVRRGSYPRRFRGIPIGNTPVQVVLEVPRVGCQTCGAVRQVRLAFADERRSYIKAFERYALDLSRHMTIRDVARHLQVAWDVVKDIQKRYLGKRFARVPLADARVIAIDEIAVGRGHRYLTVVLDLESGAVVFVGDGRGADALAPLWRRVRLSGARIEAVAMDMLPAYVCAVTEHLPGAAIVFDRFHIIRLFNEKLSDLRREMHREAADKLRKKVLKGTRWLLLKNPENLDPSRRESQRLREALRLNEPLATAYYMKEDLRQIWEQPDKSAARRVLDDWVRRAQASGIRILIKFAHTLAAHRTGILAYYDYPISTGPLEGTNTKIRVLQHQAYGFRDMDFFKLKIYALHETRFELVG